MLNGGGGSPLPEVVGLLQRLRDDDLSTAGAEEICTSSLQIRATIRLLQVEDLRRLAVLDQRQAEGELGPQSMIDWLRTNSRVSAAEAANQITVARQYDELQPSLEKVEGAISFESLDVIARSVKELPGEAVEAAQAELIQAAESPKREPQQLRRLGDEIRHRDDPEGWSRSAFRQHEKRRLRSSTTRMGWSGSRVACLGLRAQAAALPGVSGRDPAQGRQAEPGAAQHRRPDRALPSIDRFRQAAQAGRPLTPADRDRADRRRGSAGRLRADQPWDSEAASGPGPRRAAAGRGWVRGDLELRPWPPGRE